MMLRMAFHRARRALGSIPVVGSSCTDKHQHTHRSQHPLLREEGSQRCPPPGGPGGGTDQEDDGRPSNQSDGRRQLPHVAAAVAARRLVHVLDQAQLANAPLCHLVDGRRAGIKAGMGGGGKLKLKLFNAAPSILEEMILINICVSYIRSVFYTWRSIKSETPGDQ